MMYGHFTMYGKTVVHEPRKVVHAYNAFCKGYNGGNGHVFNDPTDGQHMEDYKSGLLLRDIFFTPVPISYRVTRNNMSMTGNYPAAMNASGDAQLATNYHGASIWSKHYNWVAAMNPVTEQHDATIKAQFNTICFQVSNNQTTVRCGVALNIACLFTNLFVMYILTTIQEHQLQFNYKGKNNGDFSKIIIDKGHWGYVVYIQLWHMALCFCLISVTNI